MTTNTTLKGETMNDMREKVGLARELERIELLDTVVAKNNQKNSEAVEKVLLTLLECGSMKMFEIAKLTGLSRDEIKNALVALVEDGAVTKNGHLGLSDYSAK